MKTRMWFILSVLVLARNATTHGQDATDSIQQLNPIVITATGFEVSKQVSGKIIQTVERRQLQAQTGSTVLEVIDKLTGIHIHDSRSAPGKNRGLYIRGGRDRQVLVLIDGIPVSDPSGIHTRYDLRLLSLEEIERIEIMNGAASTMYGSGAATGVINIVLRGPGERAVSGNAGIGFGTYGDQDAKRNKLSNWSQQLKLHGSLNRFSYMLSASHQRRDDLSEARPMKSNSFEEDPWNSFNAMVRVGYDLSDRLKIGAGLQFDEMEYDFDAGAFIDSDQNTGATRQVRLTLNGTFEHSYGKLLFRSSFGDVNRDVKSFNPWTDILEDYAYEGSSNSAELVSTSHLSESLTLMAGIQYRQLKNKTDTPYGNIDDEQAHVETSDPYLQFTWNGMKGFNLNIGTRWSHHSNYGGHWVYTINPSYVIDANLRVMAGFATAFIAPSTYQLFSQYGNIDLLPEEDRSAEIGVEMKTKNLGFSVQFFHRTEENSIQLPDFIQYTNIAGKVKLSGLESHLNWDARRGFRIDLSHTYLDKNGDMDYIPKHKFAASTELTVLKEYQLNFGYKYISTRHYYDQWGTGETIELDSYGLVDLTLSRSLLSNDLFTYLKVNNLGNERYEETYGYSTLGRTLQIGMRYSF
jgi:vitamin B12 transporter